MPTRTLTLRLDDSDFAAIHAELARRQAESRWADGDGGVILPEGDDDAGAGESNLAGALIAEMVRDLDEYRAIWEAGREGGS